MADSGFVSLAEARRAALDVDARKQSIEAGWDRPGGVAKDVQHRRQQQAAHDDRVEEYSGGQGQSELLDDPAFTDMNDRNTQIMIAAAAVTTRPVSASPSLTARRLSPTRVHCSWMREIRKTW